MQDWYENSGYVEEHTVPCSRCAKKWNPTKLRRVHWVLQLAALPLTALFLIKNVLGLITMAGSAVATGETPSLEYFDRYCPDCLPGQVICHFIVAIWSIGFIGYWIYTSLVA